MAGLFGTALFLSAALLFWVQPLLARLLLPSLGGAAAVWTTCLVFFQAMLLAGYAYAHVLTQRLSRRGQVVAHGLLGLACAGFMPLGIAESWREALTASTVPTLPLLGCLLAVAGLPLLALSSTSPLLQHWFSSTSHRSAGDPYFLYAASNLGSLVALLAYPLALEPLCRLGQQTRLWTAGCGLLAGLLGACAWQVWSLPTNRPCRAAGWGAAQPAIPWSRRGRWVLLAFAPSSLLLGATQYVVTDLASLPLLWVVPLALYLGSFVLAFGRRGWPRGRGLSWAVAVLALGAAFSLLMRATHPVGLLLGWHLTFLFCGALGCHAQLAADRPAPAQLTEFYWCLAVGGVLGGVFNAVVAPQVFRGLTEYPLAIVLTVLLQPGRTLGARGWSWAEVAWPTAVGVLAGALALAAPGWRRGSEELRVGVVFGLPLLLAFTQAAQPRRFALALGAALLGGSLHVGEHGRTLRAERSFFGVSRVTLDPGGRFRRLVHGNTWHGAQALDPAQACVPLAYYHPSGPAGELFAAHAARHASGQVAVIGLGTGSLASYARPGEPWTFYEVDPAVVRLARDTNCFTYLSRCAPSSPRIVLGDGRQRLRIAPDGHYTLLVVDAFSSDAIPVHLLTREAVAEYGAKLAPGGWLVFHISNRYLDLEKVLAGLAREGRLAGVAWEDWDLDAAEAQAGKAASHWVVLARQPADLAPLTRRAHWLPLEGRPGPVWSDDFSNLLGILRWK